MAAAAAELHDVTECTVCTEVFSDPRVLPCVHTFCLKCIVGWGKDKGPGDKLACPLCRKECTVPDDGLEALPRNLFVEKMIRIKELTSVVTQPTPCDMCTYRAESGAAPINPATTYCLQCQEYYCEVCASGHSRQKVSRSHSLLQIGDKVKAEDLIAQYPAANCDKHVDETFQIYCDDCGIAVCVMCYIKDHNAHTCSHINDVTNELVEEMTHDVTVVEKRVKWCRDALKSLTAEKQTFGEQVAARAEEIREKTRQLRQMIDRHEESVLHELRSIEHRRTKEIDAAYEEVERQLVAMESYTKYVNEIREKGSACDIARESTGLHNRAEELLKFAVIERTLDELGHADVTFTSSEVDLDDSGETVGELSMNTSAIGGITFSPLRRTDIVPGKQGVFGVTSLEDRLYVIRYHKKAVEVHDTEGFSLQRLVPVPKISYSAAGMAVCGFNKCLYLSDFSHPIIHRVDLSSNAAKKWPVGSPVRGVSVTGDQKVLVACESENKLQEYATDGRLVTEVHLRSDTKSPWHAVKLSADRYVVSHSTSPGVVSVVRRDGRTICSYGQTPSADVGPMRYPKGFVVTKQGDVLVADEGNDRIVAVNAAFTRAPEVSLPGSIELKGPRSLFLDELRRRLYVGENGGGYYRVIVLDNLRRIAWN